MPQIVMAAGGTGGHLFPLLATANKIRQLSPEANVTFFGRPNSFEERLVREAGENFVCVASAPLRSKSPGGLWKFFISLLKGRREAAQYFANFGADLVVGGGGFGSAPAILAARKFNIPTALLETNVFPGRATRFLASRVDVLFLGWEASRRHYRRKALQVVGVPLREGFENLPNQPEARRLLGIPEEGFCLLALGGSQGSASINNVVQELSQKINKIVSFAFHLSGFRAEPEQRAGYRRVQFWDDMPAAYAAADLVLSRSGAGTCAELAACGKPAILVPLPHSKSRDQLLNAELLASTGAAKILPDERLTASALLEVIVDLLQDKDELAAACDRMRRLAQPNAARNLADQLLKLC